MPSRANRDRGQATVLWRVAGILVGVQVITAVLAVGLSAYFASARSAELIRGTIQLRLDAVAEEIEQRATIDAFGEITLTNRLRADLPTRFPDPVVLVDHEGALLDSLGSGAVFVGLPDAAWTALEQGRIALSTEREDESWALVPILAPDGLPAAGLFVQPFTRTLSEETRGTRTAFARATIVTTALAAGLALLLGALFTAMLVRPLRRVTEGVERIGAGDYSQRLEAGRPDEYGRLVAAVNEMAARVEQSIHTLKESDRIRRELVANVGHDLRTPLAALRGYLEEAERYGEEGRGDEAVELLASARRQAESASDMVADLFELSLLEGPPEAIPLRLGPVPLGELLRDVVAQHAGAYKARGIHLDADVPAGLPVLEADGSRLVRLLSNLLQNARRHTPSGGSVSVETKVEAERVHIAVRDTGEGIAADELASIFQRYYRGEGPRTRGDAGTGLGLAIARAIARAHGGDLTAESTPGVGSTFVVTLPADQRDPSDAEQAP